MKHIAIIIAILAATSIAQAGKLDLQNKRLMADRAAAVAASESGEAGATFAGAIAEYKADKATFGDRVTAYNADMSAATNAIAATTGTTKTMGNKLENQIESLQREVLMLKQMVQDLKKAVVAAKAGR